MRSYGWRSQTTRAAAPAAPRAAIRGSAIRIAPAAGRTAFSRTALLASVCFSAVAILVPNTAHAQDATWDGATTDWNTPGNWTPPSVPTNTATFSKCRCDQRHHFVQHVDQHHRLHRRRAGVFI